MTQASDAPKRTRRKAGEPAVEHKTDEATDELGSTQSETLPEERAQGFRTPGWQRLRINWRGDDLPVLMQARQAVEERLLNEFPDVYEVMFEVYDTVREVETDAAGNAVIEADGLPKWKKNPSGSFVEDYTRLTTRDREKWLFTITTRLFAWESKQADLWAEAMFAKAIFQERYGTAYGEAMVEGKRDRIEDRSSHAEMDAAEERYFAIYLSHLSRRADSLVRSMERLAQRLRDTMMAG